MYTVRNPCMFALIFSDSRYIETRIIAFIAFISQCDMARYREIKIPYIL